MNRFGSRTTAGFGRWLLAVLPVLLAAGLTVFAWKAGTAARQENLYVAAAASLRYAFEEMGAAFRARTGVPVVFSFGASGKLAFQIEQGAPFDAFFSADEGFVDRLARGGFLAPDSVRTYAIGRLVVWVRRDSPLDVERGIAVLADPRARFVAIANPGHAPYGLAAQQALTRSGLLPAVQPKLVLADNVGHALQLVQTGNADVGMVPLSVVLAPPVAPHGRYWLVPDRLHEPLRKAAGVVARSPRTQQARAFLAFVNGEGQPIMHRYGFVLPERGP
jgi:molybdate transport system substrate-binding protein